MIDTILFDLCEVYLQGTLGVETEIARTLELDPNEVRDVHLHGERFYALLRGELTENEYWGSIIKDYRYPDNIPSEGKTLDFLKAAIRRNFTELPGTSLILEQLAQEECQLGLLSDHAEEWVDYKEGKFPLARFFPTRCYSFQSGHTKKAQEAFHYALKQLDANPERTLFIDDNPRNLRVAESVGIAHTHQFKDADSLAEALGYFGIDVRNAA